MKLFKLLRELRDDTEIEVTLKGVGYVGTVKREVITQFENYNIEEYHIDETVSKHGRSPVMVTLGDDNNE